VLQPQPWCPSRPRATCIRGPPPRGGAAWQVSGHQSGTARPTPLAAMRFSAPAKRTSCSPRGVHATGSMPDGSSRVNEAVSCGSSILRAARHGRPSVRVLLKAMPNRCAKKTSKNCIDIFMFRKRHTFEGRKGGGLQKRPKFTVFFDSFRCVSYLCTPRHSNMTK